MSAALIDWGFAVQTARRLVPPGPAIAPDQAADVVAELRADAARSKEHVQAFTGLDGSAASAPVLVVDRVGWVQANADGFKVVMEPLLERLQRDRKPAGAMVTAVGSRVTGAEAGALLGFLSTKVLGQFDPFWDRGGDTGRLLLVAPTIVATEQELELDATDFRLWVCLHEETHRVQFTAVPWLRDHLRDQVADLVGQTRVDPDGVSELLTDALRTVGKVVRGEVDASIAELLATPGQRMIIDQLTGVMSLLEGHADVVMDGVGPGVIPSVDRIRKRFDQRRQGASGMDVVLRRVLGLEAKMRQYRDGAAFVRRVIERVGMAGFNAVWTDRTTLPSKSEISDPDAWVSRVHG